MISRNKSIQLRLERGEKPFQTPCKYHPNVLKDLWNKDKNCKAGGSWACRVCKSERDKKWKKDNPEYIKKWNEENSERFKEYAKNNPEKRKLQKQKRREGSLAATPDWVNNKEMSDLIEMRYCKNLTDPTIKKPGDKWTLDHTIPLRNYSDKVCGLNIPVNLTFMRKSENSARNGMTWEEFLYEIK